MAKKWDVTDKEAVKKAKAKITRYSKLRDEVLGRTGTKYEDPYTKKGSQSKSGKGYKEGE